MKKRNVINGIEPKSTNYNTKLDAVYLGQHFNYRAKIRDEIKLHLGTKIEIFRLYHF